LELLKQTTVEVFNETYARYSAPYITVTHQEDASEFFDAVRDQLVR
jgi:hypothetical protein